MKEFVRQLALVLVALALSAPPAGAEVNLPSIGSPVDQVLSPREEAEVGARMMAQARQRLPLNEDPELAEYVDGIGQRLAAGVEGGPVDGFTFFLVIDRRINAFAAPGGYIGVNSGLFLAAKTEAQLAGVVAHEIAHVTQRHIAKAYAASQRNQYTTLAAILAGLILGSQNPQAGQAAIATGVATEAQRQINYTRANEYEADRIGISILARAGYDPVGMAGMFEVLMSSAGSSADAVPEFLRTHPLSSNRVAEAESRARSLRSPEARVNTLEFRLMQRRLRALHTDQPQALASRWETEEVSAANGDEAAARAYGLALLDRRTGAPGRAVERLERLREQAPDNLHYGLELARARREAGDLERALSIWDHFQALQPNSFAVVDLGADLLTDSGRAQEAMQLVTEFLRRVDRPEPGAWRRLAEAADAAGRPVRSHEALGEYYASIRSYDRAMRQFELAIERASPGSTEATRLEARLDQIREMQRRRLADNPVSGG